MPIVVPKKLSYVEWETEGTILFGPDKRQWKFVCPLCSFVAKAQDWLDAGAPESAIAFSCLGRWKEKQRDAFSEKGPGPCNYAGGGLFRMNPVRVYYKEGESHDIFEFAP